MMDDDDEPAVAMYTAAAAVTGGECGAVGGNPRG